MPPCGNTAVLAEVFGSAGASGSSGVQVCQALAPSAPEMDRQVSQTPSCGMADNAPSAAMESAQELEAHRRQESRCSGVGAPNSSSTFWIDPEALSFAPKHQCLSRLAQMQEKGVCWPFPSSPLRNYSPLAAGFDAELEDWPEELQWEGVSPSSLPDGLAELHTQFKKFVGQHHHQQWASSVHVIDKFLKRCLDRVLAP